MRAISSVNVLQNAIPVEQAQELVKIMQSKEKLITLCGLSGKEATLDLSDQGLGPGDAVLIANEISDMRALTSLNMSANGLKGAEVGKALGDAIAATVLKELDISGGQYDRQKCDIEFVQAFSVGLRDNGTLSSVNLLQNKISIDQAKALASMLKEHPTLKSLCGNKGDETELDMSGKMHGTCDAIMLVAEIVGNGAITSLNLASNGLGVEGAEIIAACLPKCT
jgi:hypothetical protein